MSSFTIFFVRLFRGYDFENDVLFRLVWKVPQDAVFYELPRNCEGLFSWNGNRNTNVLGVP